MKSLIYNMSILIIMSVFTLSLSFAELSFELSYEFLHSSFT